MRKLSFLSRAAGLTFAQLPQGTLRTRIHARKTLKRKFLEENPGVVEESRTEHSVHFRRADGARMAFFDTF